MLKNQKYVNLAWFHGNMIEDKKSEDYSNLPIDCIFQSDGNESKEYRNFKTKKE